MTAVEPTELVAGAWQLRPWPAAYADLDEVLVERYGVAGSDERSRRLDGWDRGEVLGFAVREITTGRAAGEVLLRPDGGVDVWWRHGERASDVGEVVTRWAHGAGLL